MTRRLLFVLSILAAALAVLPAAAPAKAKKAKRPAVTLVSPMRLAVGQTVRIRGRNFNRRARRNTVVFRGPTGRSIFAKPTRATSKLLVVKVPAGVAKLFATRSGSQVSTRFVLQVLANGQGSATLRRLSPVIVPADAGGPAPAPVSAPKGSDPAPGGPAAPVGPPPPCGSGSDWDGDLLPNALESTLGTDPCNKDTDGDGVEDGFEYKSAVDLNDDEFQNPNTSLPYPGKKPYPNPLDGSDAGTDFDGDSLTSTEEQKLWKYTISNGAAATLDPLTYSAGEQYSMSVRGSDGRRTPTLAAAGYDKQQNFLDWASSTSYSQVILVNGPPFPWWYDTSPGAQSVYALLDVNRDGSVSPSERTYYDLRRDGYLSDNERDEDADGLTNFDETHGRMKGPDWWASCYAAAQEKPFPVQYAGTDVVNPDSDGDGVRDGADDQDHDDIPNIMELSRIAASGADDRKSGSCTLMDNPPDDPARSDVYGRVNAFNPCLPNYRSRTCPQYTDFGTTYAPFDDSPNWFSLN